MRFSRRSRPQPQLAPLPPAGPLELIGLAVPPGRPVVADFGRGPTPTALWATDEDVPHIRGLWPRFAAAHATTGLWPLVLTGNPGQPERPWAIGELDPVPVSAVDAVDPAALLARAWQEQFTAGDPQLAPFQTGFPGLQPAPPEGPRVLSTPTVLGEGARLGLVSCSRPADAVALTGWVGAINARSAAEVSAVLRSWEDRYGAVVAGLSSDVLTGSCPPRRPARPPSGPPPRSWRCAPTCCGSPGWTASARSPSSSPSGRSGTSGSTDELPGTQFGTTVTGQRAAPARASRRSAVTSGQPSDSARAT
ncbi:DUF4253 domain-containing protein [Modestobacter sp. Leaf380]|uniref:DUF4253 domain-containing protein n=1 Tax=Modestobacter sp. Leaf380 TaxID=1736356 RepID=UPI0006FCB37D|nr:DUF4253 domain-containing protein [Modestobacter sp. Leaf380]KQS69270.1 hypothetical protein ASG41_21900 [Modestobacter sp. Leaf380]